MGATTSRIDETKIPRSWVFYLKQVKRPYFQANTPCRGAATMLARGYLTPRQKAKFKSGGA